MKKILLLFLSLFSLSAKPQMALDQQTLLNVQNTASGMESAQNHSETTSSKLLVQTNCERFKVDFEIKTWNLIQDSVKLNKVDINKLQEKRQLFDDLELYDSQTGLTIILYSVERALKNKN